MYKKLSFIVGLSMALVLSMSLVSAQDTAIPRGGTVVISEGQQAAFVRNFNPYSPDPTRWTKSSIYEPLTVYNPVDGGSPTHWLATDYSFSDDLLSLTYTLREGVLWSDGEDFNADDVIFVFNMFEEYPALDRSGVLPYLDSVEKVDDYTVKFNLNQIFTQADTLIGQVQIVPEHIFSAVDDPVTFTNPDPVGTGPLTNVANFNEQVLELCRNENYWQMGEDGLPLPYIDCMRMPVYAGNDAANFALINNEIDWAGNFVADIDTTYVSADPDNHHYYFWPGGATVQYYMNTTKAPFDDVSFRRALSKGIDLGSVASIGMYGYTEPSNPVALGPRYDSWVNEEAVALATELGQGAYAPDAAAAALDEAGYVDADGDGFRDMTDGSPLVFKIQVVNGWTDWVTSVQIMSQNFQDIGLNASIDTLDFGVWLNNLQTGEYDTSIGWGSAGRTPWDHFRNTMDSSLIGADGLANAQLWGRWTSPETDELINNFVATADAEEQGSIIDQLQMAYIENVVTIPLFPGPTWYEYNTTRFTGFPTPDDYYTQGSPWEDTGSRLIAVTNIHCIDDTACGQAE